MSDPVVENEHRRLGKSDLLVSPVAFGSWPIAGVTSLSVNDRESLATLRACFDLGVNFIDTAYCYGPRGESEKLIRQALAGRRDEMVLATKGGIHFKSHSEQAQDAQPETLRRECEESLQRLGTDRVELYYLHAPDPKVPIEESAAAIGELIAAGKTRYAGASNCSLDQLQAFHAVCPLTAVQLPYNMLQRDIEQQTIPWCRERGIAVVVYWALMKGLLAGRLPTDRPLEPHDRRSTYPMFQGDEWQQNQRFVSRLRQIAEANGRTVAQLVVNWTIHQPGVAVALCGAKRPWQLEETAAAMGWQPTARGLGEIDAAIASRGKAAVKRLFC